MYRNSHATGLYQRPLVLCLSCRGTSPNRRDKSFEKMMTPIIKQINDIHFKKVTNTTCFSPFFPSCTIFALYNLQYNKNRKCILATKPTCLMQTLSFFFFFYLAACPKCNQKQFLFCDNYFSVFIKRRKIFERHSSLQPAIILEKLIKIHR